MKLEIDIPEEMLESEILDAIMSIDTDNNIIKKVHIEPRGDDNKNEDWLMEDDAPCANCPLNRLQ